MQSALASGLDRVNQLRAALDSAASARAATRADAPHFSKLQSGVESIDDETRHSANGQSTSTTRDFLLMFFNPDFTTGPYASPLMYSGDWVSPGREEVKCKFITIKFRALLDLSSRRHSEVWFSPLVPFITHTSRVNLMTAAMNQAGTALLRCMCFVFDPAQE